MKNKSQRHRESNTFRFQSFQERIKNVKVSCRKYILYTGCTDDDDPTESEFYSTLCKFEELNLSEKFRKFHRGFGFEVRTLMQVIHFENRIADVLEEHINAANEFSLTAILSCLCAFAIDIGEIFYKKYFYKFLSIIQEKLDVGSHENIEDIFVCYASMFTALSKYLKPDISRLLFKKQFIHYFTRSYPWYINELAAKSLRVLIRQLHDKQALFANLFNYLDDNRDSSRGVGSLICASFQLDISNRLHSSTNYTLNVLLDIIKAPGIPKEGGRLALVSAFKSLTYYVAQNQSNSLGDWYSSWKDDSKYVWPVLLKHFKSAAENEPTVDTDFVLTILSITSVLLECRNGELLIQPEPLIQATISMLQYKQIDEVGSDILLIFKTVITSHHQKIGDDLYERIFSSIFASSISCGTVMSLIEGLFTVSKFDDVICPLFINYCASLLASETGEEKCVLEILANLAVYKSPAVRCAVELESFIPYKLNFSTQEHCSLIRNILHKHLTIINTNLSNVEDIATSLILLRHSNINKDKFVVYMKKLHKQIISIIGGNHRENAQKKPRIEFSAEILDDEENVEKLIFMLSLIMETLYQMLPKKEFMKQFPLQRYIAAIDRNPFLKENHSYLRMLDIICRTLSVEDSSSLTDSLCEGLYCHLYSCLSSTKPLVRMLSASIFANFPCAQPASMEDVEHECENIFAVMVKVEAVAPHPSHFKERLRLMRLIELDQVAVYKPATATFDLAPIYFMIGQLTIDYKDLWPPALDGITAYAHALPVNQFWPVWYSQLRNAADLAFQQLHKTRALAGRFQPDVPALQNLLDVQSTHDSTKHLVSRNSALDFRDRLWKGMVKFATVCDKRGEDVVTLFMSFVDREVYPNEGNVTHYQDITKRDDDMDGVEEDQEDDEESEESEDEEVDDEEEEGELEENTDKKLPFRRSSINTLCNHMALFGKLNKLKSIHKSRELEKMFHRFLYHPIVSVQKQAMTALYAFNHKFLVPYKDFLNAVLDEKSLRKELTLFSTEDNGPDEGHSLKPVHEVRLMEVLLRILYGKMNSRSTVSRKTKHSEKQALIVRFLASFKQEHIRSFLNLLFDGIFKDFEGNTLDILFSMRETFNPKKAVPMKRLKGFLKTVNLVIEKMGNLLSVCSAEVLKVTLFVFNVATVAVDNGHQIVSHLVPKFKTIRQLATRRLISFFTMFDEYAFTVDETAAIFVCIRPQFAALTRDSLWTSNILMKLFICWAENAHYHSLLAISRDNHDPAFRYIVDVLQHPRCTEAVIRDVLGLVSNLLGGDHTHADDMPAKACGVEPILDHATANGYPDLTIGEALVFKYSEAVLAAIHRRLVEKSFKSGDLTILLHICEWVAREESAAKLLDVIVPILENPTVKEEQAIYLLDITSKMIRLVDEPGQWTPRLLELFASMKERHVRASLCSVIGTMAKRDDKYSTIASWCSDLNSYDPSKIESEDLQRRHSSFKAIDSYLETCTEISEDFILCILCNCFFMVEHVPVTSILELASTSIQSIFAMLGRLNVKKGIGLNLLNNCLRKLRPLLKEDNLKVQTSAWVMLRSAVGHCHNNHKKMSDLRKLYDAKDPDGDFFRCIVHVQIHKRVRVLTKLAERLNEGTITFERETILGYLMPAITTYLFTDEYAKQDAVITAAILCLGAFARCLPWLNYQSLLRHYLKVMDRDLRYLRQGVRSLEAVIDAFHENLGAEGTEEVQMEVDEIQQSPVYSCLVYDLIPKIAKVFTSRSSADDLHKVNKKIYPEDDDIKKISLGLALAKLMKKLPKDVMDTHARNITLKLINFLASKASSIRKQAREMLVKVMREIGPSYVSVCVRDMSGLLEKGYQCHVCVFTTYSILHEMVDNLEPKDVDQCLTFIINICIKDMFGNQAEEKDVSKIITKCPEARAERGDAIFGLVSRCIDRTHLQTLLKPLYDIAAKTSDKSIVNKVIRCLGKISNGLNINKFIDIKSMSIFIYTMYDEKIGEILATTKRSKNKHPKKQVVRDCLLLEPEPKVLRYKAKVSDKATAHVFVEFGLNLLSILVGHRKYNKSDQSHLELLDSFVPKLGGSLLSEYPAISIHTLSVIDKLIMYPLPSLKHHLPLLCKQMFVVLDQFSMYNLPRGKNYNMMQRIFTTLSRVLRSATDFDFETDHLKVLIYYARDNLPQSGETHSIFLLLKAMLFRKINIPEFHELMKTIQTLSISSENVTLLDQTRSAYLYYMMNYPKFSNQHIASIEFYTGNIKYDGALGRMSALLMMQEILSKYPRDLFKRNLDEGMWLILSQEHYKESSTEPKKLLAKCINLHFESCKRKEAVINLCMKLLDDDEKKSISQNATRSSMVVQSLRHMVDIPVEKLPKKVFLKILPRVTSLLDQTQYNVESLSEAELPVIDLYLHSLLELLSILGMKYLSEKTRSKWNKVVDDEVWTYVHHHLSYPLLESKLAAANLIDQLFCAYPVDNKVAPPLLQNETSRREIVFDLCKLFDTVAPAREQLFHTLCKATIRNLLYLIQQSDIAPLYRFAKQSQLIDPAAKKFKGSPVEQSTYWILLHLSKQISRSKSRTDFFDVCREYFLYFIATIIMKLPATVKECSHIAKFIVTYLDTETADQYAGKDIVERRKEVVAMLKDEIGVMQYNEYRIYAE